MPEHLRPASVAELRARIEAAKAPVQRYVAEVRLSYSGKEAHARVLATLAVARPAGLRYEVRSPLGTTLHVLATNGVEVQAIDMQARRFLYGPARADNLDRLLGLAPLGLDAAGWVGLFFGELDIPASAALAYDAELGVFALRWLTDRGVIIAHVDPEKARLVAVRFEASGSIPATRLEVVERDALGLPRRLRITAPAAALTLEASLFDVDTDPPTLQEGLFVLDPPPGFARERL